MDKYTPKDIGINIIAWNTAKQKWRKNYVQDTNAIFHHTEPLKIQKDDEIALIGCWQSIVADMQKNYLMK